MAQFPNTTAADGIWTLKQTRRASLGENWPPLNFLPAGLYTDSTYGALVASFSGYWGSSSYTTGIPGLASSNVILSDSDFQLVRDASVDSRVYYVWGTNQSNYVAFNMSEIESADDRQAPTTSINPDNFGLDPNTAGKLVHWWDETTGFSGTGSDYSFVSYFNLSGNSTLDVFNFSSVKEVDTNISFYYRATVSNLWIFYK